MKTIVLGITSGIAAFKTVDLADILKKNGMDVFVILTGHARRMVAVSDLERITGNPVYTSLFPDNFDPKEILKNRKVDHIDLADRADLIVISPATANIIGKMAGGIADDFLTTTVLATTAPILVCPSMNSNMWANEIVQENLAKLKKRNFHILPPVRGSLACGYDGVGRLPDVSDIFKEINAILSVSKYLKGKKIMVTAGGTYEPIDSVRGIANRASGKMGVAIAEEAYKEGAEVLLVRSHTSVKTLYPIAEKVFQNSEELKKIIQQNIPGYDYIFHTAAVSDYIPEETYGGKLDSKEKLSLHLIPAEKIITQIKKWNPEITLIGFKAVYHLDKKGMAEKGKEKIETSGANWVAVNDVGRSDVGFGVDDNEMVVVSEKGKVTELKKDTKKEIAKKLLSLVAGQ